MKALADVSKLALTVPIVEGEVAFSLTSRLALRNGAPFNEFLVEMGIPLTKLLTGRESALTRLAEISGADFDELRYATPRELHQGQWWFRGEPFSAEAFRSTVIRGCPACLHEDALGAPGRDFIRGIWMLELVRTCPHHGIPLEPLWTRYDRHERHDVALRLAEYFQEEAVTAPMGSSTAAYDRWVHRRLSEEPRDSTWLDQSDMQAAAAFCAALGHLVDGRGPAISTDPDHADLGFGLARAGQGAIRGFLTEHQEAHTPESGQKRVFGKLYSLLAGDAVSAPLHPFRQLLRDHVSATWPLGPGDELLGEPVFERRHVSVGAMARLLKVDPVVLRERLGADLSESSRRKPDDWALFDAGKVGPILSDLTTGLSDDQFCEQLSLSPELFQELAGCGVLDEARCENGSGWDVIAGQGIVERLLLGSQQVGRLAPEWISIEQAAAHLEYAPAQITERIRGGRLPWIGRHLKQSGFASILVNISGLDGSEISAEMFALSQGLTFSEMLSFFRKGHAPAEIAKRETGRKDRIMLTPDQVAGFHENFVSFRRLALAHKLSWDALEQCLKRLGVAPVDGCLRIYRKSETSPLLHDVAPEQQ